MVALQRCDEILSAIVQEHDGGAFVLQDYRPNRYEQFGELLISPYKSCVQRKSDSGVISVLNKIAQAIMTPLAYVGACFKQIGEKDNPGCELRKQIMATHLEYETLVKSVSEDQFLFAVEAFNGVNFEIHKAMLGYYEELSESFQNASGIMKELIGPSSLFYLYHFFEKHPEFETLSIVQQWINPFRSITAKLEKYEEGQRVDFDQESESITQFAHMLAPEDGEWHDDIAALLDYIKTDTTSCSLIKKIDATLIKTHLLQQQLSLVYDV